MVQKVEEMGLRCGQRGQRFIDHKDVVLELELKLAIGIANVMLQIICNTFGIYSFTNHNCVTEAEIVIKAQTHSHCANLSYACEATDQRCSLPQGFRASSSISHRLGEL